MAVLLKRLFADQLIIYSDLIAAISAAHDGMLSDGANRTNWIDRLESLRPNMQELELDASEIAMDRLQGALRQTNVTPAHAELIRQFAGQFRQVLVDQLSKRDFLMLTPDQSRRYRDLQPFGTDFPAKFPSATYDVEEATKCLALERSTACAFHLMRVVEICLRAVSKSLHDPNIDPTTNPNWGKVLVRFDAELAKPKASRSPDWASNDAFYSAVTARLKAIKDAWRNTTMHVERTYNQVESEDLWTHIAAFAREVAGTLHE